MKKKIYINYYEEYMGTNDKKIDKKELLKFGKKYEKIWEIDNFKIIMD